ncbi:SGNH/GDSL hydrolase family protein [Paenibacillus sinopodophylli]|uniref:SGNH/GDSL hydrolase family protein n=1 Tax=Paenibacillus sinopodophylli TaxID=1837342 RepID=UPI00110CDC70|nr:SGNH/GDSL hydrolase family protein [Paenibacillus sinopodophylli]
MLMKKFELYNVQALVATEDDKGMKLSRVPEVVRSALNENAQRTAFNGCGVEIRFNLHSEKARVVLRKLPNSAISLHGVAEVYHGGFQGSYDLCPQHIGLSDSEIVMHASPQLSELRQLTQRFDIPYDPSLIRILLPYDCPTLFISLEGDTSPPRPEQTPSRRMLAYGSSITHGGGSVAPSETYAMNTARLLKMDLINLGFAGSAHMEPEMADYIASRDDWEIATLEMGINVIGTWSPETFAERIDYFIETVAHAHPDRWIFCIDMFTNYNDLVSPQKATVFRNIVRDKVAALRMPRVIHLDGTHLLPGYLGLSADLVHPSPFGMLDISQRLASEIKKHIT